MSDEFTIAAKSQRDNLVAEHKRYEEALAEIVALTQWSGPLRRNASSQEAALYWSQGEIYSIAVKALRP